MQDQGINTEIDAAILPHLPRDRIKACYADAPGDELRGKFVSPESSAALVANTFGFFLERPELLEGLPTERALEVQLERELRLPWSGGRHPCLDVLVESAQTLIGVESKRYEPFRSHGPAVLSAAYKRQVWGPAMAGYESIRDLLYAEPYSFAHLDAAQLVKHALGLRSAVQRRGSRHEGKRPLLLYVYAEPLAWADGRAISMAERRRHEREIERFALAVDRNEVEFRAMSYQQLLACWDSSSSGLLRAHAREIREHFDL